MGEKSKVLGIAVLVAISLMTNPALAQKKYSGQTLNVHVDITPRAKEQIAEYIAPKLKEKWGIDTEVEVSGVAGMFQKMVVMKENPRFTVVGLDLALGVNAAKAGLLAPIDVEKAPALKQLYDWAYLKSDGKLMVLTQYLCVIGLIYNEEIFKKQGLQPPTAWADLWRKDLCGRLSITAPESTWGLAALAALARIYGGSESNINIGFEKVKSLLPCIHTLHMWSTEMMKLLQLNEVWMGTTGSHIARAMRLQGFPARWVLPKEGAPMENGGLQLFAKAPYQDAGYDFLNLYYSTEFQLKRVRESGIFSPNKEIWKMLTDEERKESPVKPEDMGRLMSLDFDKINQDRQAWIERWHKEIKK